MFDFSSVCTDYFLWYHQVNSEIFSGCDCRYTQIKLDYSSSFPMNYLCTLTWVISFIKTFSCTLSLQSRYFYLSVKRFSVHYPLSSNWFISLKYKINIVFPLKNKMLSARLGNLFMHSLSSELTRSNVKGNRDWWDLNMVYSAINTWYEPSKTLYY